MSDLKNRLIKNSTIELTSSLESSILFTEKDQVPTPVPMINVALSGSVDGGLLPGLTMLAGPSKHFKSAFALLLASSFLRKYPDGVILFYDSEFGTPESYFNTFGVAADRVVHSPILDVEQLKFDIVKQLQEIKRGDNVLILIDSIGNLASKKEVEDALNEKSVADMSRAKQFKSLFRIVTPHLTLKNLPCVVVNHTYKEIGMFPKDIVSGGTGSYYSANDIWIIGRQQDKEGTELQGFNFIINIEKSRMVQEKSKIPINVSFEHGINRWSGLFDLAIEGGFLKSPSKGWYTIGDDEQKYRRGDIEFSGKIWKTVLANGLADYLQQKYKVAHGDILRQEDDE